MKRLGKKERKLGCRDRVEDCFMKWNDFELGFEGCLRLGQLQRNWEVFE